MRDPDNTPAPDDIEQRRIDIYTGLIYRNIESFIANGFPVLRKITEDDNWHRMIRDYVNRHISHTPYFPKMSLEFLDYLEKEADDAFANRARQRLERVLGGIAPNVWVTTLEGDLATGLRVAKTEGVHLKLKHLVHNTRRAGEEDLRCVCLVLDRGNEMRRFLPDEDVELQEGDRLLFAGRSSARREISWALKDPVLLLDFATPERIPRTAIGRWLARRNAD